MRVKWRVVRPPKVDFFVYIQEMTNPLFSEKLKVTTDMIVEAFPEKIEWQHEIGIEFPSS